MTLKRFIRYLLYYSVIIAYRNASNKYLIDEEYPDLKQCQY